MGIFTEFGTMFGASQLTYQVTKELIDKHNIDLNSLPPNVQKQILQKIAQIYRDRSPENRTAPDVALELRMLLVASGY